MSEFFRWNVFEHGSTTTLNVSGRSPHRMPEHHKEAKYLKEQTQFSHIVFHYAFKCQINAFKSIDIWNLKMPGGWQGSYSDSYLSHSVASPILRNTIISVKVSCDSALNFFTMSKLMSLEITTAILVPLASAL